MHRTELLQELAPIMNLQYEEVADRFAIHVTGQKEVTLLDDRMDTTPRLTFSEGGVSTLIQYAGLPRKLLERLDSDTLTEALNQLLRFQPSAALLTQGDEVVNVIAHRTHRSTPVERVIEVIETAIPEADYARPVFLPGHAVQIEVVGVEERAVAVGDLVRAGAVIRFSPLGTTNVEVQGYVRRLACTNGMLTNDLVRSYTLRESADDHFWHWLSVLVGDAYGTVDLAVGRYQALRREVLTPTERAQVLAGLLDRAKLGTHGVEAVHAQMLEESVDTAYDVLNLVTWASSHAITDPRRILRAQQAAADFTDQGMHERICAVCRRRV